MVWEAPVRIDLSQEVDLHVLLLEWVRVMLEVEPMYFVQLRGQPLA